MLTDKFVANVLQQDQGSFYRDHIARLGSTSSALKKYAAKTERTEFDSEVLESLKIAFKGLHEAENISISASFEKQSKNFLNKLVLKTLKIAQASLAVLLFKTPLRVAVAYNALQWVIKYLQKELEKAEKK